jgi:hypothetical protein
MQRTGEDFMVAYNNLPVKVESYKQGSQLVFRVVFTDGTQPLFITKTSNREQTFWTSVPEGRQKLAEAIGQLIETYFLSK